MELTTFGFGVSDKKSSKMNVSNLAETRIIHILDGLPCEV